MAYKNDGYLVIANKFGSASGEAKAMLWETYDRLRDLTVSGSTSSLSTSDSGGFLYNMASLLAPSSFATVFGSSDMSSIPGTSYFSTDSSSSSYGTDDLYSYSGFPSGYASSISGWGSEYATGYASDLGGLADVASAAAYGVGTADSYGLGLESIVLPVAGVISGWGNIMANAAPYLGEFGLPAIVMGNLMTGTSSAALSAYQTVSSSITANADTILSNKVANLETVCNMLDTQSDVVKKMLKESIEGDSSAMDNL
ncbi:MAG: hypothetical protein R3Y28_05740 [Candidatus Gastranaerophilales bacterium]